MKNYKLLPAGAETMEYFCLEMLMDPLNRRNEKCEQKLLTSMTELFRDTDEEELVDVDKDCV